MDINYTNAVLDCNFLSEIKRLKRDYYKSKREFYDFLEFKYITTHHYLSLGYPIGFIDEGFRLLTNEHGRRKRSNTRIKGLVNDFDYVYFGTLTFNNDALNNTNEKTRRRYVSRYLKKTAMYYVANIDFGDKGKNPQSNEREHYHCVITLWEDTPPKQWDYGYCKFEKVRSENVSAEKIAHYVNKLTNHALKVERTGKAKRLIYSRPCGLPF